MAIVCHLRTPTPPIRDTPRLICRRPTQQREYHVSVVSHGHAPAGTSKHAVEWPYSVWCRRRSHRNVCETLPFMRAVVQRVTRASVSVEGDAVGSIGSGLLALIGVGHDDAEADVQVLARKLVGMRIFRDELGAMNRSVVDIGGGLLIVSQFTLYGDVRKGRRPSFVAAARPEVAEPLVDRLVAAIAEAGVPVASGRFGAMMEVELLNDGPVTILVETHRGLVV